MKRTLLGASLMLAILPSVSEAQSGYPRTRRGGATASPASLGAYKGVLVNFHGKLKVLDKKKIIIETDDKQTLSIRVSNKTKFLDNGKAIKPSGIDLETPVTIDASEDTDLSVVAVNVTVDSPDKPPAK